MPDAAALAHKGHIPVEPRPAGVAVPPLHPYPALPQRQCAAPRGSPVVRHGDRAARRAAAAAPSGAGILHTSQPSAAAATATPAGRGGGTLALQRRRAGRGTGMLRRWGNSLRRVPMAIVEA
eukprot:gene18487-18364_t